MRFSDRCVVVIGGASGIGLAIARAFAAEGARVGVGDVQGAEQAATHIVAEGGKASGLAFDVSDRAAVGDALAEFERALGGVDVLVNSAGLFGPLGLAPIERPASDELARVFEVNVYGVFHCTQAAIPLLRRRGGGAIVNVASVTPYRGAPLMSHYVASKGAVIALTRCAARELGEDGIRVNAVAPGFTLSDAVLANPAKVASARERTRQERALRRDQTPADIVGPVLFLASSDAAFVTGQTVIVDGGVAFT